MTSSIRTSLWREAWQKNPHDAHVQAWRLQIGGAETLPPQAKRVIKLLSDEKVLCQLDALAVLPLAQRINAREARIENLVRFVEEVAALFDQQPAGSHLRRDTDVPITFSTPEELKKDLGKAHTTADTLIDVIKRTAPTLQEQFPLRDACQLIDLLEKFSAEAVRVSATYAERQQIDKRANAQRRGKGDFDTPTKGTPASPGGTAGKHSVRNWLLQKVGALAAVHLGGMADSDDADERAKKIRGDTFTLAREIARVLMGDKNTINERTARDHLPSVTRFPEEGRITLDDWLKKIGP